MTIAECDPNGKFITLENTHRSKDENLGEHKLKRKLDGNRREIVYSIPANVVLKAGKTIKVCLVPVSLLNLLHYRFTPVIKEELTTHQSLLSSTVKTRGESELTL